MECIILKKQHKWVFILSFPIYANGSKQFKIIELLNNTPIYYCC